MNKKHQALKEVDPVEEVDLVEGGWQFRETILIELDFTYVVSLFDFMKAILVRK